jgi:hypothetical protein
MSITEQKNWLLMLAAHYEQLTSFLEQYIQELEGDVVNEVS